ncbi:MULTISPECIES: hypothetical protein [Fictibacillus]|uniref:SR1 protein n=1 Tax=Fictibacillus terranigra TaxID=3058424 RepID=A0ABT8EB54_9BACL|nr:hypothetical protein [Fictibacillus sp. CENA-BCM004]MDN4075143.1 hypothetical protein [Fictibacillus sp. CENA-BCM004]
MEETKMKRHCSHCNKETMHIVREDALELEYTCTNCKHTETEVKTFF